MTNLRDMLNDLLIEYTNERNEIPKSADYPKEVSILRERKIDQTIARINKQLIGE